MVKRTPLTRSPLSLRSPHRHASPRPRGLAHCILRTLVGMHTQYQRTMMPRSRWTGWPVHMMWVFEKNLKITRLLLAAGPPSLLSKPKRSLRGCVSRTPRGTGTAFTLCSRRGRSQWCRSTNDLFQLWFAQNIVPVSLTVTTMRCGQSKLKKNVSALMPIDFKLNPDLASPCHENI